MKANELRKLSTEELTAKEKALKEELFNLRFQMATGSLTNPQRASRVQEGRCQDKDSPLRASAQGSRVRVKGGYHRGNHQRLSQDPHRHRDQR